MNAGTSDGWWFELIATAREERFVLYPMRVRDFSRFGYTDVLFPAGAAQPDD